MVTRERRKKKVSVQVGKTRIERKGEGGEESTINKIFRFFKINRESPKLPVIVSCYTNLGSVFVNKPFQQYNTEKE